MSKELLKEFKGAVIKKIIGLEEGYDEGSHNGIEIETDKGTLEIDGCGNCEALWIDVKGKKR